MTPAAMTENEATNEATVVVKRGRDKPVRQRHPWIFSGAIQQVIGTPPPGAIVSVQSIKGEWLARGYYNPQSQISLRLLSWDQDEAIDENFWHSRLAAAVQRRESLLHDATTNAYRLIHAESDYLPGLTVDRYNNYLVMQVGTLGIDQRKEMLAHMLLELTGCTGVIERSEANVRRLEGLPLTAAWLAGTLTQSPVEICENGLHFFVDLAEGQKTGFYLDQRENRQRVAAYCTATPGDNTRVLNAFSYTGAFAVYVLRAGGAHVTNLDASFEALEVGEENLRRNGFDPDLVTENIAGDVFEILRDWRAEQIQPFDLIILDPPKFANSKQQIDRALRGYKDLNLLAMQLLAPGGILATFSCSGLVDHRLFQKMLFGAALDAGRSVQILEWLHQGCDHPVALTFPEGEYLKGFLCRVL